MHLRGLRAQRRSATVALLEGLTAAQRTELTRACEVLIVNVTRQRLARRAAGSAPAGGALCRWCDFDDCGRAAGNCPAATAAAAENGSSAG